ncbi:DUF262 domain-containing protein [Schaedlerella arabinosiphila]|uniref:DUF262 domain-containing protein n=1 Tax=Schaedlerella arabinosiphila TaxID=2044587 RepID=A0A9X5H7N9_9FIRM|nr:DUF262 domain-containing protein [Schaedlerella arabinosiphila]KAI4440806.1 hypothetical protein C824_003305 [Schaedlerella arabinosiphila]NDO69356.1 DUF262 domain-containing protein [Schaedlerella arabinosiphila]
MAENISDFKEIVRKIESNKILLPDFQREFVWKDEEQQKKIVASVLAKMPIGSILLLKSKPDEYTSKIIGCKNRIDASELSGEVEFLLDGQQRITVLTNVFSNIIHDQCLKVTDLISPSLKRRFFLRIPKWDKCQNERDLFGVYDLNFRYQNPDSEDPDFLSADIYPFIECLSFLNNDEKVYNPQKGLSVELDNFCISYEKGYLIPLFLLAPSERKNKKQALLRYGAILDGITNSIGNEIMHHFVSIESAAEKEQFIDEIIDDELCEQIKEENQIFEEEIENRKSLWKRDMNEYLEACIKSLSLNRLVVKEEQRARAIDIYENLNRGGVSLNTFDLIMARVAKVSKDNFYQRIINYMHESKVYSKEVIPDFLIGVLSEKIEEYSYNATLSTGCYNSSKNEIASKYIDAFLDVLSLFCHNKEFIPNEYKLDNIKRNQILQLEPQEIDQNCECVCKGIDRALFFFQTRCGIRNIQEINYSLMLVLVATLFVKEEYFIDKKIHKILEAWYWASVFSGEYDKDQNVTMISNLQAMVRTLQKQKSSDWILTLQENVLDVQNFSDKSFLLLEKVEEDRYPKTAMRYFMCQYLLAKTYADMFTPSKRVSVFDESANDLEAHHIIPLGTVKKVGESAAQLRKNQKHICNSPLNFVYITKDSNKEISDDTIEEYVKEICDEAKSALYISAYTNIDLSDDGERIKKLLSNRFDALKGNIKQHIKNLLQ